MDPTLPPSLFLRVIPSVEAYSIRDVSKGVGGVRFAVRDDGILSCVTPKQTICSKSFLPFLCYCPKQTALGSSRTFLPKTRRIYQHNLQSFTQIADAEYMREFPTEQIVATATLLHYLQFHHVSKTKTSMEWEILHVKDYEDYRRSL